MNTPPRHAAKRKGKTDSPDVGSVADFMELVNSTVGKHFRCCICFSILEDPVMLPCNHPLCRGCATQCLRQNQRCPQCLADIPNLRTLQGRNKWITEMVDSLRDCLNEVGVSLTQHAPVPAKYRDAPPPSRRARRRAHDSGGARANRNHAPSPPAPASCGGGSGAEAKRKSSGGSSGGSSSSSSSSFANRKRAAPARSLEAAASAAVPPLLPHGSGGRIASENDAGGSMSPPPAPFGGRGNGDAARGRAQQPGGEEEEKTRLPRGWAWSADAVPPVPSLPPPPPQLPFVLGDLVSVDPRTWPGMNKHGGVARICAVLDPPGSAYDVRYSVGRIFDRGVEAHFVHPYAFPTETVGIRSRRSSGSGCSSSGSSSRRASRRSGGSSGGSMSLGGESVAVYSAGASSRSAAASASLVVAAAAAADVATAATPTRLPSPPRETAGAHSQGEAAAAAVAAVVVPEIERSPGAAEGSETRRDDVMPAGKEGDEARGFSRRSDAIAPPAAVDAGGGLCSSDAGAGILDDGAAAAEVGEAEGSLTGATQTREHEGGREGRETGGGGGVGPGALASDGSGAEGNKEEEGCLRVGTASSPVRGISAKSARDGSDWVQEHAEEEEEKEGEKEKGRKGEEGGKEQGEGTREEGGEQEEKEEEERGEGGKGVDPQHRPEPRTNRPRLSAGRPDAVQHGTDHGQRENLPLSGAQSTGLKRASLAGGATEAPVQVEGEEVVETDVEGGVTTHLEVDDEGDAARPLEMEVEDDATMPPQTPKNPDLLISLRSPLTGRDAPSASDCGSSPPGVAGPASPCLSGRGGFSERLDPGPRELDAEGPKPAGVPDGGPPANKAERELPVEVDDRGDTGHRAPDPSRSAPESLRVPSELPAGLAEEPQRLPGQLVPLLPPPPPRPTLARWPTAPSPMPPPPPVIPSLMQPPPPPPPATLSPKARTFVVGDLVNVPSRSSPGVNKEGGVAKVTRVHPDGTYNLKYCVRLGAEKGVAGSILSSYTLDDDDGDADDDSDAAAGGDGGGGSSGGGGGGGRDSRERHDAAVSSASSSPVAAASARVRRRRVHRTNRGYCPPDAAAGQANAACLSYLLGETQHPELDFDNDLGEDLDPDEGSPNGRGGSQKRPAAAVSAIAAAAAAASAAGAGVGVGGERAAAAEDCTIEARGGVLSGGGRSGVGEGEEVDTRGGRGGVEGEVGRPSAGCEGVEVDRIKSSGAAGTAGRRAASRGSTVDAPRPTLHDGDTAVTPKTLPAPRDRGRGTGSARSCGPDRIAPATRKRARVPGDPASRAGVAPASDSVEGGSGNLGKVGGGRGGRSGGDGGGEGGGEQVPARARRGQSSEVVLIMSSLESKSTALAKSMVRSYGWRLEAAYTEEVTHAVCGADLQSNKAKIRSAKYLRAVAGGKWVVNEAWLQECKKRRGRAEEEAFEIAGDRKSTVPSAPRRSRLAHAEPGRPGLFQGIVFHFRGEFGMQSPPLSELAPMLLANGGTIVGTVESLFSRPKGGERTAGSGGGGGGGGGGSDGGSGGSGGGGGSWKPKRVVIFQPSSASPGEDVRMLERDLETFSTAGMPPGAESGGGGRGGGSSSGGGGGGGNGAEDGDATVHVVKPLWLVDSVGSFRVLKPTVLHQVQQF